MNVFNYIIGASTDFRIQMTHPTRPTPEQLQRWAKLDELETTAFAGREISQQEFSSLVQAMLDGSNLVKHLAEIKERRQQLIKEAAELEEYEKWLENHIRETLGH